MRKIILFCLSFLILISVAPAQTVIENPETPLNKNAGRALKLKEVLRITDESGEFYFKAPRGLIVAPDETIYLQDEFQLLKFSAKGKFIKNLIKKGDGPGEIKEDFAYSISKNEIYIYDIVANKIVHTDLEGNLIEQFSLKPARYNDFLGLLNDQFIFTKFIWLPPKEWKSQLHDVSNKVILVSKDGSSEKRIHDFPIKWFLAPRAMMSWASFYTVLSDDSKKLFVSHTREYLIKLLDLEKEQVIRSFRRKYSRAKYVSTEDDEESYKKYNMPRKKYEIDIQGLFSSKGLLWVKTSTKDKSKGNLIDVFNKEGKYLDNFYLNLKGSLMAIKGDYIFVREKDENENLQIVKYRIIE